MKMYGKKTPKSTGGKGGLVKTPMTMPKKSMKCK